MKNFNAPWHKETTENSISEVMVAVVDCKGDIVASNEPYYPQALNPELADLISTAPEMLEALEVVCNSIETTDNPWKGSLMHGQIKNAIRKAKGE